MTTLKSTDACDLRNVPEDKLPGTSDVLSGLAGCKLPLYLAKADIRQRYRRSSLGPFWITISTGVMIACIGVIFGNLFKSPMSEFFPFLTAGLILWSFIQTVIIESTTVFIHAEPIIKQLPIPIFSHVIRMVARNFYIFLHNIVIYPIVCLVVQRAWGWADFLAILGMVLLIINLLWMSLLIGIFCTRFRDMAQIIQSCLQIVFYVTPIIWMPSLLPARTGSMVLAPNPFYHLLEVVRAPLMNQTPSLLNWEVAVGVAVLGWAVTLYFFNRYKYRIAYWL
jgi:lipopolysaccharide transport system permease protein